MKGDAPAELKAVLTLATILGGSTAARAKTADDFGKRLKTWGRRHIVALSNQD